MASAPSAFSPSPAARPSSTRRAEDTPPDLDAVERILERRRLRSPTSSPSTARRRAAFSIRSKRSPRSCARHGKRLLIDAMSAFGALPLDARTTPFDAVAASANKCLEGVPGLGFVVCRRDALAETEGQCDDAVARPARPAPQSREDRAVPLHPADPRASSPSTRRCEEFGAEGGVAGRGGRYAENARILHRRHALARLRDAAARRAAGADHRHLPHAEPPEFRLPALLRCAEGARLRDLSGQADGRRLVPHRLHRPSLSRATCAARWRRCARRSIEMGVALAPAPAA